MVNIADGPFYEDKDWISQKPCIFDRKGNMVASTDWAYHNFVVCQQLNEAFQAFKEKGETCHKNLNYGRYMENLSLHDNTLNM